MLTLTLGLRLTLTLLLWLTLLPLPMLFPLPTFGVVDVVAVAVADVGMVCGGVAVPDVGMIRRRHCRCRRSDGWPRRCSSPASRRRRWMVGRNIRSCAGMAWQRRCSSRVSSRATFGWLAATLLVAGFFTGALGWLRGDVARRRTGGGRGVLCELFTSPPSWKPPDGRVTLCDGADAGREAGREGAACDGAGREGAACDGAGRDGAACEGAGREGAECDGAECPPPPPDGRPPPPPPRVGAASAAADESKTMIKARANAAFLILHRCRWCRSSKCTCLPGGQRHHDAFRWNDLR